MERKSRQEGMLNSPVLSLWLPWSYFSRLLRSCIGTVGLFSLPRPHRVDAPQCTIVVSLDLSNDIDTKHSLPYQQITLYNNFKHHNEIDCRLQMMQRFHSISKFQIQAKTIQNQSFSRRYDITNPFQPIHLSPTTYSWRCISIYVR